jgi:hydrogenase maturation protein HypF
LQSGIHKEASCIGELEAGSELVSVLDQQVISGLNTPMTTAAGRVFDSFSAWLGLVPDVVTYDGQAAVRLENCAASANGRSLADLPAYAEIQAGERFEIDWSPFFRDLAGRSRPDPSESKDWALAFHRQLAKAARRMVEHGREQFSTSAICLSGGVFMNRILCMLLLEMLEMKDLQVFMHEKIPPNDAGIAAGQITHTLSTFNR